MPSVTLEKTMPHYAAVGRVASKWAQLDHHIQELIWGLAGLDEMTGACITSQIGNSGRLMDALLALLEQKGATKKALQPLRSLSEVIGIKQRMRNRIVHDPWYFRFNDDGTTTGYTLETSKTVIRKPIKQDYDKLEKLIQDIESLYLQLTNLVAPWYKNRRSDSCATTLTPFRTSASLPSRSSASPAGAAAATTSPASWKWRRQVA
jgi:hypothetical protein